MMFKERPGPPQKDGSLESAARLPLILKLTGWEGLGTTHRRGKLPLCYLIGDLAPWFCLQPISSAQNLGAEQTPP